MTKKLVDVEMVSGHLRESIHDINNALFVTKGFVEELSKEIQAEGFEEGDFDAKTFKEMFRAVSRNVAKLETSIQSLRGFAREGIFDEPFVDSQEPKSLKKIS